MADAEKITMRVWRGDDQGGEFTDYVMRPSRARSCST